MAEDVNPTVQENSDRAELSGVFLSPKAQIVRMKHKGKSVFFTIGNPNDVIQSEHIAGRFYEPEELSIIRDNFPKANGHFLDIGANVGNHSVYVAMFLNAQRVVLIEPNPAAIPLLESNIFLNGLEDVCERKYLGYGLSNRSVTHASIRAGKNNLGKARVTEGTGDIPLRSGDALLVGETFDLIKIDVEGMEMKVLDGLSNYLKAHQTPIFVEVDRENYAAFDVWLTQNNYDVTDKFQRYRANTNFMIRHTS